MFANQCAYHSVNAGIVNIALLIVCAYVCIVLLIVCAAYCMRVCLYCIAYCTVLYAYCMRAAYCSARMSQFQEANESKLTRGRHATKYKAHHHFSIDISVMAVNLHTPTHPPISTDSDPVHF
jgi:hypothetical protein